MGLFLSACELGASFSGSFAGLWSQGESAQYSPSDMREGEGRGERSWRVRCGLPPVSVGHSEGVDVPELGHEVKSLEGEHRFRLGNESRIVVGEICMSLGERGFRHILSPDQLNRIRRGEISSGLSAELDDRAREIVQDLCRPSRVLDEYNAMVLTLPRGWIMVPRSQYDRAFYFYRISSGTPRYGLRLEYISELIRASGNGLPGTGDPTYRRPKKGSTRH